MKLQSGSLLPQHKAARTEIARIQRSQDEQGFEQNTEVLPEAHVNASGNTLWNVSDTYHRQRWRTTCTVQDKRLAIFFRGFAGLLCKSKPQRLTVAAACAVTSFSCAMMIGAFSPPISCRLGMVVMPKASRQGVHRRSKASSMMDAAASAIIATKDSISIAP